jgi:hypothetical protein
MVSYKASKEEKAKDWDFIFKFGLVFTLLLSGSLFIVNLFVKITEYPLLLLFALPALWSIIGLPLAHKYSSAEMRDMHRVSDFVILSLCGYFAAFFLTVYTIKTRSLIALVFAVLVYLLLYYYSWVSLRRFMERKNIPLDWLLALLLGLMLLCLSGVCAWVILSISRIWGILILIAGVIFILSKYWGQLVKQFGYATRYKPFIYFGLSFNYFSLLLWTLVFVLAITKYFV